MAEAGHADFYVLSAAAPEGTVEEGTFSCVLLDADTPNIRWQAPWQGFGMRSNSSRTARLEDVPSPPPPLLGREGADALGGRFDAESEPGRGSTFRLTLPPRLPRHPDQDLE